MKSFLLILVLSTYVFADQLVYDEFQLLTPTNPQYNDKLLFGYSVALSNDASVAAVGGCYDNSTAGAVWVYQNLRDGAGWSNPQKLVSSYNKTSKLGNTMAMTSNGNVLVVGGYGSVSVFVRKNSTHFIEQQVITSPFANNSATFGINLDISADGGWLIVGTYTPAGTAGCAFTYKYYGGSYQVTQILYLGATNRDNQLWGWVAMSPDASYCVIGQSYATTNFYVYALINGTWTLDSNFLLNLLTTAVDIVGTNLIINWGNYGNDRGVNQGAFLFYQRNAASGNWTQTQFVAGPDPNAYFFATALKLSNDSSTLILAGINQSISAVGYVFSLQNGLYVYSQSLIMNEAWPSFVGGGQAVAFASNTILIGWPFGSAVGYAWLWTLNDSSNSNGCDQACIIGASVGASVFCLIVLCMVFVAIRWRRQQHHKHHDEQQRLVNHQGHQGPAF